MTWRIQGGTLEVTVRPSGFAGPPGERTANISLIHVSRVEIFFPR